MSYFKRIANSISKSPWIIPIYLLFVYGLFIFWNFFLEDYQTNIVAYQSIPTIKVRGGLIEQMARFIQIAPILFGYVFIDSVEKNKGNFLYGFLSLFFLMSDWFIGIYVRSNQFTLSIGWIAYSALEDFIFFTVGSEFMITMATGIIIATTPDVFRQIKRLLIYLYNQITGNKFQKPSHNFQKDSNTGHKTYDHTDYRTLSRYQKKFIKSLDDPRRVMKYFPKISDRTAYNWLERVKMEKNL